MVLSLQWKFLRSNVDLKTKLTHWREQSKKLKTTNKKNETTCGWVTKLTDPGAASICYLFLTVYEIFFVVIFPDRRQNWNLPHMKSLFIYFFSNVIYLLKIWYLGLPVRRKDIMSWIYLNCRLSVLLSNISKPVSSLLFWLMLILPYPLKES